MAVFWQGPVKVTLETSPFPSGKLEEKENPAGVFQEGKVTPPPPPRDNLLPSMRVCRPGPRVRCKSSPLVGLWCGLLRGRMRMQQKGHHDGHFFSPERPPRVRWTECCESLSHALPDPGSTHPEPGCLHFSFSFC